MGEWAYSFTTLDLGTKWRCGQLNAPATVPWEKALCNHWIRGWLGPRAGRKILKILIANNLT
jgi:hypothetical protein